MYGMTGLHGQWLTTLRDEETTGRTFTDDFHVLNI